MISRSERRAAQRAEETINELREELARQEAKCFDAGGLFVVAVIGPNKTDVCGLMREFVAAHASAAVRVNRTGGAS